jgi:hypothetical protein
LQILSNSFDSGNFLNKIKIPIIVEILSFVQNVIREMI